MYRYLILGATVLMVILLLMSVRIVRQGKVYIVETLGKYSKTWEAGFHIKLPLGQRVAKKVSLKEQVAELKAENIMSKDGIPMVISVVVYFTITDPYKSFYGVENYLASLEKSIISSVADVTSRMSLDDCIQSKASIGIGMVDLIGASASEWGIGINKVEIKGMLLPELMQDAIEAKACAEREKMAEVLRAEGNKNATILKAEGKKRKALLKAETQKEQEILEAEGRAKAMQIISKEKACEIKELSNVGIPQEFLDYKKLEVIGEVSKGKASKVYIPSDMMRHLEENLF